MQRIELQTRLKLGTDWWAKRPASTQDFKRLVSGSASIYEAGELKVVYLEFAAGENAMLEGARRAVGEIEYQETFRTAGLKTRSRVFGAQPRITIRRRDYCSQAALASEAPEQFNLLCGGAPWIEFQYAVWNSRLQSIHAAMTRDKLLPEWRMAGSMFTSGIINEDNPLLYHRDFGNYPDVWSGMLTFREHCEGGLLSLPEYELGIRTADRSLLMFDGQGLVHGVTPIVKKKADGYRRTIVYYSLAAMWKCLTAKEEVRRIQRLRVEREEKRAGRTR